MQRFHLAKATERRIRASLQYSRWAEKNRATACVRCGGVERLHVHHVVDLYHVIYGLWKFYGDWDAVFKHTIAMHEDNRCEGVTLCGSCHDKLHPGRAIVLSQEELRAEEWCVVPRQLDLKFAMGSKGRQEDAVGLLGFQVVFGLGWHLLNGQGAGRLVEFHWRRFAEILGKTPSASFHRGLGVALESLRSCDVVEDWTSAGNEVEVHLTKNYTEKMLASPWFVPLIDVKTSSMSVLVLRWLLSLQANRTLYSIGMTRLAEHMCLGTQTPTFVKKCVLTACEEISWAGVECEGDKFRFRFERRGFVPIHSLRAHVVGVLRGH